METQIDWKQVKRDRFKPCPHPERHRTETYIPCQDCDVRANPEIIDDDTIKATRLNS